jgi:hypothetical protein
MNEPIAPNEVKTPEQVRENIMKLESVMLQMKEHHIEIEIKHYFAPGLYLREMMMPANSTVVGKIHKTEHICILSQGTVSVLTDEGIKTLTAPATIHSMPGIKRVLYALTDVVWTNIHHNPGNEQDLDKIEEIYIAKTFEEALAFNAPKQIKEGE